jgi:hypothetical protein
MKLDIHDYTFYLQPKFRVVDLGNPPTTLHNLLVIYRR